LTCKRHQTRSRSKCRSNDVCTAESHAIAFLSRQLAITLQALAPLPKSSAQAKRVDPLTHLQADLEAFAPFMREYREIHTRCIAHPDSLSSLLFQTKIMKDIVEEQKYSGRTCRQTDLHQTREVVFRQLLRLFDAALEGKLEAQRLATAVPSLKQIARHSRKNSSNSLSLSMSPSSIDEDRTLSRISAILPFSLPLSRRRLKRHPAEVPLGVQEVQLTSDCPGDFSEDVKWKVEEDADVIEIRPQ
jgi:hypothetical protein